MTSDRPELFAVEVREWLEDKFPRELAGRSQAYNAELEPADAAALARWREAMGAKGWGTPTWPEVYGGGGLSAEEAATLSREMAKVGAENPIGGMGVMMFGPTLLEYGSEVQKLVHLPLIAKGRTRWCQGFSEPGAGSDLAALQTRAEDRGEHFLVNGQKIWTSGAHLADWCFCLVRTDSSRKQGGISFLLIDMRSKGVEARPIRLINGASMFCEVFFTGVEVPSDNLVGPLNGGWPIAKRLLQHERAGLAAAAQAQRAQARVQLPELAREYVGEDAWGRLNDPDLRQRIIRFEMELRAFQLTSARVAAEARDRPTGLSGTAAILKNVGSFLRRDGAELTIEIMGHQGLGWEGSGFNEEELNAMRTMLYSKAGGIAGGSQEIQYNIIAKRFLGLPDPGRGGGGA